MTPSCESVPTASRLGGVVARALLAIMVLGLAFEAPHDDRSNQ